MAKISYLECTRCQARLGADEPRTVCPQCAGSLFARYDLQGVPRNAIDARAPGMWRYAAVLPDCAPVTLGEGWTPMLPSRENPNVLIKDEGLNPTGSFKARGLCLAVSMARAHGLRKLAIPSAGNAAGALAAYAAAAGIEAHIFMPKDVPQANLVECRAYGAQVTLVDGLIGDCARQVAELKQAQNWFDISTLKEPFRVEGKKTMGYEIAEQLAWTLPDAIIYPTGGGVGLIGMWKAFDEMEQMGWMERAASDKPQAASGKPQAASRRRPKMIAVQASGCAPIPKAWSEGKPVSEAWPNARTLAAGLRVPKAYADYLILDILRRSGGAAVAVTDDEIMDALRHWASVEGVFAAPEGAASLAAYRKLLAEGFLSAADQVVLFNTGSGLKHLDVIAAAEQAPAAPPPAGRSLGGIIQPY
jgi:threonine synthase